MAASHAEVVEVLPPRPAWDIPFWHGNHVDLHRTATVQAILAASREVGEAAGRWRRRPGEPWKSG